MTYLIIGIVCFVIIMISGVFISAGVDSGNNPMVTISVIFLILSVLGLFIDVGVASTEEDRHPELKHERLLKRILNDNNELQKFYIDHPEFKEQ